MAAIFYSKVTGIVLALAIIAGLVGVGIPGLLDLGSPLDVGVHVITAAIAIYVGFTANRNLAVPYAKVSSLLYFGLAIFGMYQGHPYGNITAHLVIGLWAAWAGFGAYEPMQARR